MLNSNPRFAWIKKDRTQTIAEELSENNQCYVLITCGEPSQDGRMQVEMTYGGDPVLAAYLVQSASMMIDSEVS